MMINQHKNKMIKNVRKISQKYFEIKKIIIFGITKMTLPFTVDQSLSNHLSLSVYRLW